MAKKPIKKTAKDTGKKTPKTKALSKGFTDKTFKKGESGNPNGRPLGQRNYATIYREAIIELAKARGKTAEQLENILVQVGISKAIGGDYRFYQDLHDRISGKPVQRNELTGAEGKDLIPDPNGKRQSDELIDEFLTAHNI